jgi:hypothetical protein
VWFERVGHGIVKADEVGARHCPLHHGVMVLVWRPTHWLINVQPFFTVWYRPPCCTGGGHCSCSHQCRSSRTSDGSRTVQSLTIPKCECLDCIRCPPRLHDFKTRVSCRPPQVGFILLHLTTAGTTTSQMRRPTGLLRSQIGRLSLPSSSSRRYQIGSG